MYVCVLGSKKCYFSVNCNPNSVFIDASMMHLKVTILRIFMGKSWFVLATNNKRKCVRKPILTDLGTQIFKTFSLVEIVMVPLGETDISKLLTAIFLSIRSPLFESWFGDPAEPSWIYDEICCKVTWRPLTTFAKMLHHRYSTEFQIRLCFFKHSSNFSFLWSILLFSR